MDQRERILDAVQELTTANGRLPSILEVATAIGLTKQGVLHYFPSRAALDTAVISRAVGKVDAAMTQAAAGGSPVATYLGLSSPTEGDRAAAAVLAAAPRHEHSGLLPEVHEAVARWQSLIADEVGDPVRAEVVRLVGDGLFAEALFTGTSPSAERIAELVAHLRDTATRRPA